MSPRPAGIHFSAILFLCAATGCAEPDVLRCGGYVEAEKIEVGSRVGGRIEKVFVDEGDEVKAGQVLVQFESKHLEAQREEAAQRVARLQAALDKAVAGPRTQEVEQARRHAESATAQALNAASQYKRALETGARVVSKESIEQLETVMKTLTAEEQSRRAELNLLEEGTRAEDIVIARRELEESKAREIVLADQLNEATVRAPVDSIVEVCDLQPGDLVAAGVPLAVLVRKDELWVRCFVPTTQLSFVHPNQRLSITVDSRPNQTFEGTVLRINRVAEYTPRNVQTYEQRQDQVFGVKIRITDPGDELRPGMAATVLIPLRETGKTQTSKQQPATSPSPESPPTTQKPNEPAPPETKESDKRATDS